MKSAFIAIGCIILVGGIAALMNPGPMTVFPSGSKWREPVAISADQKKMMGAVSVALGALTIVVGFRMKKPPVSEGTES